MGNLRRPATVFLGLGLQEMLAGAGEVSKTFHIEEATFRRVGRAARDSGFSRGRENFKPSRWYPSACVMRTGLARKVREDRGSEAPSASGALGISSRTEADRSGDRRTTTSAPPALMLRAVANSSRSFPFSSRLLTKTGIARGNRTHLRRSFSSWRRLKSSPHGRIPLGMAASHGPNYTE